jgi:hypothetical protein
MKYKLLFYCIVTCIPIARQRLGKHVPAVNTPQQLTGCFLCGPRRDLAMQWCGKHASTIEWLFSARSVLRGYLEDN